MDRTVFKKYINTIYDFPKPGIAFKDISPILMNTAAREALIDQLVAPFKNQKVDIVAGIESRGFLLGPAIATRLDAGFIMVRKPGKLPGEVTRVDYELEYGTDTLEVQLDGIHKGANILIHDDVLATGGTLQAAIELVKKAGGNVVGAACIMELDFLNARDRLKNDVIHSVIHY
jgi:adenine phosphoribosyltransferase